jgi:hypothetical protein
MIKKYAFKALFLTPLIALCTQAISDVQHTPINQPLKMSNKHDKQKIKVKNKTSMPVIANIFVSNTDSKPLAGYYGVLLPAHKANSKKMPEFYWFKKQALGGFKKPDEQSKVRIVDILNHGFANKVEIIIPNEKTFSFDIKPMKYTIAITQNENDQPEVLLQESKKAKAKIIPKILNTPEKKESSLFHELEKEIEK